MYVCMHALRKQVENLVSDGLTTGSSDPVLVNSFYVPLVRAPKEGYVAEGIEGIP